jgi:hypothetical protein
MTITSKAKPHSMTTTLCSAGVCVHYKRASVKPTHPYSWSPRLLNCQTVRLLSTKPRPFRYFGQTSRPQAANYAGSAPFASARGFTSTTRGESFAGGSAPFSVARGVRSRGRGVT